jgi:hypothetical protein
MYSRVMALRAAQQADCCAFREKARDERVLDVAIVGT